MTFFISLQNISRNEFLFLLLLRVLIFISYRDWAPISMILGFSLVEDVNFPRRGEEKKNGWPITP